MKNLLIVLLCLWGTFAVGQSRLMDKEGEVVFFSNAPLEDIKATTKQALAILDTSSQQVAASIQMKSFKFRKSLMQEHFNENYIESEKYPKATFSGKLQTPINYATIGTQEASVSGEMTMHGITKPFEAKVTFTISEDKIEVTTVFDITIDDFDIKIPTLLFNKIAETVEVTSNFSFNR